MILFLGHLKEQCIANNLNSKKSTKYMGVEKKKYMKTDHKTSHIYLNVTDVLLKLKSKTVTENKQLK